MGNGNGALAAIQPKPTALMSSEERSAQTDAMRTQLVELTRAHNRLVTLVDDQRTHVLKLADEQRGYVDAADRGLRAEQRAFVARTFRQRLRWLLTGR